MAQYVVLGASGQTGAAVGNWQHSNNPYFGRGTQTFASRGRNWICARRRVYGELAQACADGLVQEWQGTQVWELHEPQPLSPNQVAASFSRILKRDVQAVVISESEWTSTLAQMGNSPSATKSYSEMLSAFNNGTLVFEEHGTKRLQGKTTIDEAVRSWASTNSQS